MPKPVTTALMAPVTERHHPAWACSVAVIMPLPHVARRSFGPLRARSCAGHGMAWHGMAWHGMAWHGMAHIHIYVYTYIYIYICIYINAMIAIFTIWYIL